MCLKSAKVTNSVLPADGWIMAQGESGRAEWCNTAQKEKTGRQRSATLAQVI
jgi:hypothetical protein